eukprot:Rhum_TRINITY_DN14535_c21_g1::Rhum_TRINITY_DN14535_c21_g1_i1::g.98387::m.98387
MGCCCFFWHCFISFFLLLLALHFFFVVALWRRVLFAVVVVAGPIDLLSLLVFRRVACLPRLHGQVVQPLRSGVREAHHAGAHLQHRLQVRQVRASVKHHLLEQQRRVERQQQHAQVPDREEHPAQEQHRRRQKPCTHHHRQQQGTNEEKVRVSRQHGEVRRAVQHPRRVGDARKQQLRVPRKVVLVSQGLQGLLLAEHHAVLVEGRAPPELAPPLVHQRAVRLRQPLHGVLHLHLHAVEVGLAHAQDLPRLLAELAVRSQAWVVEAQQVKQHEHADGDHQHLQHQASRAVHVAEPAPVEGQEGRAVQRAPDRRLAHDDAVGAVGARGVLCVEGRAEGAQVGQVRQPQLEEHGTWTLAQRDAVEDDLRGNLEVRLRTRDEDVAPPHGVGGLVVVVVVGVVGGGGVAVGGGGGLLLRVGDERDVEAAVCEDQCGCTLLLASCLDVALHVVYRWGGGGGGGFACVGV